MANGYYFFPGDYLRDTIHLGWFEDCAYRRLLDLYYTTGHPIRNDRAYILRAVRASEPEQQAAVDTVLSEFFKLGPDGWHQPKCDERLEVERRRSEGGRRGGIASGASRRESPRGESKPAPELSPNYPQEGYPQAASNKNKDLGRSKLEGGLKHPARRLERPSLPFPSLPKEEKPRKVKTVTAGHSASAATWEAYRSSYLKAYGVEPVRNAKVNAQLGQFVGRVPAEEAPEIASFYLTQKKRAYVERCHSVGMMLIDAEALRTLWLSGRSVPSGGRQGEIERLNVEVAQGFVGGSK